MTDHPAAVLARHLAAHAENVCRRYLPNGRRAGHYWLVGDVHNSRGRSLYVRLGGPPSGRGAVGKWTDAATGEHGDLLDLIRLRCGFDSLGEAMDEARSFLALPCPTSPPEHQASYRRRSTPEAARRLFLAGRPIAGTPAAAYLRARSITALDMPALRFHPRVSYRDHDQAQPRRLPAMLGAITGLDGRITGVNRTWLDIARLRVADLDAPRKVLGVLLGHGVRFGSAADRLLVGEGIETVLSLKTVLPAWPMVAGLTATHLAALILPSSLTQLVIARDRDAAGARAAAVLRDRAQARGIAVRDLVPCRADFNDDLRRFGPACLGRRVQEQIGDNPLQPAC